MLLTFLGGRNLPTFQVNGPNFFFWGGGIARATKARDLQLIAFINAFILINEYRWERIITHINLNVRI